MHIESTRQADKIARWCNLGLQHRVHFRNGEGWMEDWYRDPEKIKCMAISIVDGVPVGIAVVLKRAIRPFPDVAPTNVGVYTKANYRRRGIGSSLVKRCERLLGYPVRGDKWNQQAAAFYRSLAA